MVNVPAQDRDTVMFANPFKLDDLLSLDLETLRGGLRYGDTDLLCLSLAYALHGADDELVQRFADVIPATLYLQFQCALREDVRQESVIQARHHVLNEFFWELIYWKMPEMYEALTEGEHLHPDLFRTLQSDLAGKTVLDIGAGSGRASFAARRTGAECVYAVEPSPGLLRILREKVLSSGEQRHIVPCAGRFEQIPLPDQSSDVILSCSAFTAEDKQGGEPGLKEMLRILKLGGKIVIIWPRAGDHVWLEQHGFHYVRLPAKQRMCVSFRSIPMALQCARLFYARNTAVQQYIITNHTTEVPFATIGLNPPDDYYWLKVDPA